MLKGQIPELLALGAQAADKDDIHTLKDIWESVAPLFPESRYMVTTPDENILHIALRRTPEEKKKPAAALTELLKFAQPSLEIIEAGNKEFGVFSNAIGAAAKEASPEAVITYVGEFLEKTKAPQAKPARAKNPAAAARL